MDAQPNPRRIITDVTAEDFHDADLCRTLWLVLVSDQPERSHVRLVADDGATTFEQAVPLREQSHVGLFLTYLQLRLEAVLTNGASKRSRENTGLDSGQPRESITVRVPRSLVVVDQQL